MRGSSRQAGRIGRRQKVAWYRLQQGTQVCVVGGGRVCVWWCGGGSVWQGKGKGGGGVGRW